MRRVTALVALAVAGFVIVPMAVGAAGPKQDSAVGGGERAAAGAGGPVGKFEFSARSGPSGENATGQFKISFDDVIQFQGDVTCLSVDGTKAILAGTIRKGSGLPPDTDPGSTFLAVVNDGGNPAHGTSPDTMSLVLVDATLTPAEVCASPASYIGTVMFPLDNGNIVVRDS